MALRNARLPDPCLAREDDGKSIGGGCDFLLQGIFPTRDWTQVSHIAGRRFTVWASRESPSKAWSRHGFDPGLHSAVCLRVKPSQTLPSPETVLCCCPGVASASCSVAGALGLVPVDLAAARRADLVTLRAFSRWRGCFYKALPISLADGKDHSLYQC